MDGLSCRWSERPEQRRSAALHLGADPMATAIALTSHVEGTPIPAFIVRKEAKGHGAGRAIEGPLPEGCNVAVVDDTCTSGGSLINAIEAAEAAGCTQWSKWPPYWTGKRAEATRIRRRGYDYWTLLEATPDGKVKPAA